LKGILYGVGVGPGEPELITLKAIRVIEGGDVIAVPRTGEGESVAYSIAEQVVPAIHEKPLLDLDMPMTRDIKMLDTYHSAAAGCIMELLDDGKKVVFLTLGDPAVYSTYMYIHKKVLALGGEACMVPGVTSFCAAAAAFNTNLAEGGQLLHIIPASYDGAESGLDLPGVKVLMKTGKSFSKIKRELRKRGQLSAARMIQKCGLPEEVIYEDIEHADENASYFSIILVKDFET